MFFSLPHRRLSLFSIIYFLITTLIIFAFLPDWGNDDPYVTYRYAENLYAGRGFVYNPGEPLLSTTTPLFALLLAGVRVFWSNLPRAANLIGAASLAAGALFLWDIARQWKEPCAGWAALALYPTFGLLVRTLGSETPVFLALCLGALALYLRNRFTGMALLLALAILMRGDAAILGVVIAVDWLIKNPPTFLENLQKIPWKAVAVGAVILLAWAVFAIPYFGSPLPITLAVKRAQGLMNISEKFAPGFWVILKPYFRDGYFVVEVGLLVLGFFVAFWRARRWLLLVGWAGLYFLAYTALGVTRYFWYYAPLVPGMVGMIGLGISAVERFPARSRTGARALSGVAILLLAGVTVFQTVSFTQIHHFSDDRLNAYRLVGEWFAQNTLPKANIGALEVGVIGYYAAPRQMVDFAGLIQPDVADLFAPETTYETTAIWAIETYRPNFVVLHDGLFPSLEQTLIAEYCRPVQHFSGTQTGYSQDLSIYHCQYP